MILRGSLYRIFIVLPSGNTRTAGYGLGYTVLRILVMEIAVDDFLMQERNPMVDICLTGKQANSEGIIDL